MAIMVKIFDDKNKSCEFDDGEDVLISNCYVTLLQIDTMECSYAQTGPNGEDAVFAISTPGVYWIFETLEKIEGTKTLSYFDQLIVKQPFEQYTSTTPRKYKLTITDATTDVNVEFGHTFHQSIPHQGLAYMCCMNGDISLLYQMDMETGTVTKLTQYPKGEIRLNAIAYTPLENTLYGMYYSGSNNSQSKLFRIEGDASFTACELKIIMDASTNQKTTLYSCYIGCADIYGNYYFNYGNDPRIMILSINPNSLDFLYLRSIKFENVAIQDWSMNSNMNALFGFDTTKQSIVKINLGSDPPSVEYLPTDTSELSAVDTQNPRMVGVCSTDNGMLYFLSLKEKKIYRTNIYTIGEKKLKYFSQLVENSSVIALNPGDAANYSCDNIEDVFLDYGNAVEDDSLETAPYKSTLKNNGPYHFITDSLFLGKLVLPTLNATLGPTDVDNDSTIYPLAELQRPATEYTIPVLCYNTTGKTATLYAWLDFNTDGIFSINEASVYPVESNGYTTIGVVFHRPANSYSTTKNTFLRLRLTTDEYLETISLPSSPTDEDPRSLGMDGAAKDGEVEDYLLEISDIYFEKSVDKEVALIGETIVYTISLTNYGMNETTVQVLDPLDLNHLVFKEAHYVTSGNPETTVPITLQELIESGISILLQSKESATIQIIATVQ